MKSKNKTTGVIKDNKDLEIKIVAEVKKEDPKNAEEIIRANTTEKRAATRQGDD